MYENYHGFCLTLGQTDQGYCGFLRNNGINHIADQWIVRVLAD
jgi:hypothetical protein